MTDLERIAESLASDLYDVTAAYVQAGRDLETAERGAE